MEVNLDRSDTATLAAAATFNSPADYFKNNSILNSDQRQTSGADPSTRERRKNQSTEGKNWLKIF
jgi:hypothetical protein